MTHTKKVLEALGPGSRHWVGDGFPVHNIFPSNGVDRQVDPFLMLDYVAPFDFPPSDRPRGVGEHPHRGFETVTIAYQGSVSHRDSAGNAGTIRPGDVQWMTAASGVVHEELHEAEFTRTGGPFEMVQLWVNLPARLKMSPPRYQGIGKEQIPVVDLGGGAYARIIAGDWNGTAGPAKTFTPINVFDVRLPGGTEVSVPAPEGHNTALVLLRGSVLVNGSEAVNGSAQLVLLSGEGNTVAVSAQTDSVVLFLTGDPIGEPVASSGPFVMNTQAELRQAVVDYRSGRMGRLEPEPVAR